MKLLKFYSPSCMPCKAMTEILEQLSFETDLNIKPVDISEDIDTAIQWQVRTVPTLVCPETQGVLTGVSTREAVEDWVHAQNRLLAK